MLGERLWKLRWSASSAVWQAMLKGLFSLEVSSNPDLAISVHFLYADTINCVNGNFLNLKTNFLENIHHKTLW